MAGFQSSNPLQTPVRFVKGVGPKLAEMLGSRGIGTAEDLVYHLPARYLDRSRLAEIRTLEEGKDQSLVGEVVARGITYARGRRRIFQVVISDGTGAIRLKWFRFKKGYMEEAFRPGVSLLVSGRVTRFRNDWQIVHPTVQIVPDLKGSEAPGIVPLYPPIPGFSQKYLRKIVGNALDLCLPGLEETIPSEFRDRHRLMGLGEALSLLHRPPDGADSTGLAEGRSEAHRRFIFEELFFLELGLALKRNSTVKEKGISIGSFPNPGLLPFRLTGAQERVVESICEDLKRGYPMNRLIQGDVGSGKTAVAAVSAEMVMKEGYQVAVMAPTEILADQHFRSFRTLLGLGRGEIALLKSSMKEREKKWVRICLREGRIPLVVGTHALIQDDIVFKKLGLVVVDEQHRFGVVQRKLLCSKACPDGMPHVLVMTATPIPRTLAMTIYGELDLSIIDEMPPGRKPVETRIIGERERSRLYETLRYLVTRGEQVFIVYPLVEETEKGDLKAATQMAEHLQKDIFPDFRVGLLHGRRSAEEKEEVMKDFLEKRIDILVATTVVEVGIDVPSATCMVIEHPERFGLSQLHQLRGRIGRGDKRSLCILLRSGGETDVCRVRLKVMEETSDGFRIAEEDLKIRGPGDFLGTRQSGIPDLRFANLIRDLPIISETRKAAFDIIDRDPLLAGFPQFKRILRERWRERLELADVG